MLTQMYRTALTTGYAPKRSTWIDMAQTDVPHYALKGVIDFENFNPPTGADYTFQCNIKYYFQCRNTR